LKLTHDLGLFTDAGGRVLLIYFSTDIVKIEEIGGLGLLQGGEQEKIM